MEEKIRFTLNGKDVEVIAEKNHSLLVVLRSYFNLTGTKYGCGEGHCGACTVLMNNEAVRSCNVNIGDVAGTKITTIEGLGNHDHLHPVQKAFVDYDALQCGYCTPGMIMNAMGLLLKNPNPSRKEIMDGMEDNFCRCGAHVRIIEAIFSAAHEMKKQSQK